MNILAVLSAVALATSSAATEIPKQEPYTIIIDHSAGCGVGRIAHMNRDKAERQAKRMARKLRAEGREVQILTRENGVRIANPNSFPAYYVGC